MEVEVIKAKTNFDNSAAVGRKDRLRVAAYCRVSTADEEQIKSYDSMVKYYTDTIIIDMQPNGDKWIFTKGDNGYYLNVDNRKELFMSNEEYGQKTYPSTISEGNQHTIRFSHRDSYITTEYLLNISDSDKIPVMALTYDKDFKIYDVMIGANYVSYR